MWVFIHPQRVVLEFWERKGSFLAFEYEQRQIAPIAGDSRESALA